MAKAARSWERRSRKIAREKAVRKWWRGVWRRAWVCVLGLGFLAVAASGAWMWMTGRPGALWQRTEHAFFRSTAGMGFALRAVYLEGRRRTPLAEINAVLQLKRGAPTLALPLDSLRARLEKLSHVRRAEIERTLPGTLHIRITEREPIARWQHDGEVTLVDQDGIVMSEINLDAYGHLLLVTGHGAPSHVAGLMETLSREPALAREVAAAIWTGERRWNIRLKNGAEIKLPERDSGSAWKLLARLDAEKKILQRRITMVDLRTPGRVFIRLAPDVVKPPLIPAKTA